MNVKTDIERKDYLLQVRLSRIEKRQFAKLRKETGLSYSEMLRKSVDIIQAAMEKKPLDLAGLFSASKEASETIVKTITKSK